MFAHSGAHRASVFSPEYHDGDDGEYDGEDDGEDAGADDTAADADAQGADAKTNAAADDGNQLICLGLDFLAGRCRSLPWTSPLVHLPSAWCNDDGDDDGKYGDDDGDGSDDDAIFPWPRMARDGEDCKDGEDWHLVVSKQSLDEAVPRTLQPVAQWECLRMNKRQAVSFGRAAWYYLEWN